MKQNARKRTFVQKPIQPRLAIRCVIYWCCCLVSILLFLAVSLTFSPRPLGSGELLGDIWASYSAAILASLLLLPLIVWDMIKFSHRVVGPLIRLEREMKRLADGESVRPLQFREGDFWHGLAKQFNALRMRHIELDHKACASCKCEHRNADEPVAIPRYPV